MNKLYNCLILFIFIILTFKQSNNPILNKLYLFLLTSILQIIIISVDNIKNKSNISTNYITIIKKSLLIGLTSLVGYSLYHDLLNINDNITAMIIPCTSNQIIHSLLVGQMIILPTLFYKMIIEDI